MYSNHPFNRFCLALVFCLLMVPAQAETPFVELRVTGLENAVGNLLIGVYDSEDKWLSSDNAVLTRKVDIASARQDGIVMVQLELPAGEYAFVIIFDRNGNGKLDRNFIGVPKEPFALSNNARPRLGPPKFKDAAFQLGASNVVQNIEMKDSL